MASRAFLLWFPDMVHPFREKRGSMMDAEEMQAFREVVARHGRSGEFEVREVPEPPEGGGAGKDRRTVVVSSRRTGVTLRYPAEPGAGWVRRFRADLMHGAFAAIL